MKMNTLRRQSWALMLIMWLLMFVGIAAILYVKARAQSPSNAGSGVAPSALLDLESVRRYQQTITPDALASRLYFLASDLFEGREAGTRGQKLAANYLASQYRRMGLAPKGTAKTNDPLDPAAYFQPFNLYRRDAKRARLEVKVKGSTVATSNFSVDSQDDLAYFAFGRLSDAKASGVVFAGHGIADSGLRYDDYAALQQQKISVDGKWVVILADEPMSDAETSLLPTTGHLPSPWSQSPYEKRLALWQTGRPAGLLIVSDAGPRLPDGGFAEAARRAARNAQTIVSLPSLYPTSPSTFPSTYIISQKLADQILAPSGRTARELAREIRESLKPTVFEIKDVELSSTVVPFEPLETENVLAFIEGSDPVLKNEVLVITAHYDHLGVGTPVKGDSIYNGAADDGSGTVVSLAMAEAFMQAKRDGLGPRRSILFLNPSAEEKGTLGSSFFVDSQPVIPLDRIVADINMDGVGGRDTAHSKTNPDYIYIVGSKELSGELMESNRRLNDLTGTRLWLDEMSNSGSDHFNFERHFVPFIYYSTGFTEHYHRPSDEPRTIDYEHLTRVARLAFATAWQVTNQDTPPARLRPDQLVKTGYRCRPCPLECDSLTFDEPGVCPVCDMALYPKYEAKK